MSKQSKKQRKRRERQRRRRRRALSVLFKSLYPNAPDEATEAIVAHSMATNYFYDMADLSNPEIVRQAALTYIRQNWTDYTQSVEDHFETFLESIVSGESYSSPLSQRHLEEAEAEAWIILQTWKET